MIEYISLSLFLIMINITYGQRISIMNVQATSADFVPMNSIELLGIYTSIRSKIMCATLCHQDSQCRTIVYDSPTCKLYQSSIDTGSIILSSSVNSIVGTINYNINLSSIYNQSCNYCSLNRYLVCTNNQCQCPSNTFWNGKDQCLNQLYVNSSQQCMNNNWCRQDLNLTCQNNQCQCPYKTFWNNQKCVPCLLQGASCNTSDQCRNDLNLTCSKTNLTCTALNLMNVSVINGTIPAKYSSLGIVINATGVEWYRGFDGNVSTMWNAMAWTTPEYLFLTFDKKYLLNSIQLTVTGDINHDPKLIELFFDQNGTSLIQSFIYSKTNITHFTFPPNFFNNTYLPVITNQLLLSITRWSTYQVCLVELTFIGSPY